MSYEKRKDKLVLQQTFQICLPTINKINSMI